ncbi:MAG TPA: RHS repeat-associated core domain-containing protein [Candidatus Dormibacteraeota bacterium]|jgi:RHS repeat-associated protein|nr:RHS repeat-associated core domain-containing protein [Candidatus Dormibacteraeota bacterium]
MGRSMGSRLIGHVDRDRVGPAGSDFLSPTAPKGSLDVDTCGCTPSCRRRVYRPPQFPMGIPSSNDIVGAVCFINVVARIASEIGSQRPPTTGQVGYFYLRARFYDPATAQFVARDPALASTREPYAYAQDAPLDGTDPSGLWCSGLQGSASGILGDTALAGVAGNASFAVGICGNGDVFGSITGGGLAKAGKQQVGYPGCPRHAAAAGVYGGAGLGTIGSADALQAADLGGPFTSNSSGVGYGVGADVSYATGSNQGRSISEVTTSFVGPAYGVGGARYNTNTGVASFNAPQQWNRFKNWARHLW